MKATITTNLGTFELDGDDGSIKEQIADILHITAQSAVACGQTKKSTPKERANTQKRVIDQPRMLSDLLTSKDEIDSVKKFFGEKAPGSHVEKYATLTLWLKNEKGISDVSIDEMWTLYKDLNIRQPKNLSQTFRDGKSKKNFFGLSENGRYYITSIGEAFVDFDLPHNKEDK